MDRPCQPGLPSSWYYDEAHFARELQAIWAREWLCVGRAGDWPRAGSWRRFVLGDQQLLVVRDGEGRLHGFHNTCRHRGSALCTADEGRFPAGRIVCPYHAWSYSLDGELLSAPLTGEGDGFRKADYPLYPIGVCSWRGFVFLQLDPEQANGSGPEVSSGAERLAAWPLEDLALAHRETHEVACNWKVFWENYSECYHCPGVHPELCRLVPLYAEGLTRPEHLEDDHPLRHAPVGLRSGAITWSIDGQTTLPNFPSLGPAEQAAGMTFADFLPGMFMIAHVDHVRTVRVWPLGPERTRLTVDWLLAPEALAAPGLDLGRLVAFAGQVVREDARICEINQAGLRSRAHAHGVLLPFEDDVAAFDDWVRARLQAQGAGA